MTPLTISLDQDPAWLAYCTEMALEERARSCLLRFRHKLEQDIKPSYLMDHMISDGVLSVDEEERISTLVSLFWIIDYSFCMFPLFVPYGIWDVQQTLLKFPKFDLNTTYCSATWLMIVSPAHQKGSGCGLAGPSAEKRQPCLYLLLQFLG